MKSKKENPYKEVLTQLVIDVFEKNNNQLMNYKQVAAKLNITDTDSKVTIADILVTHPNMVTSNNPKEANSNFVNSTYISSELSI